MLGYLFLPFSALYGLITDFRNWAYDQGRFTSYDPAVPVISVGNLSTGGTGKTPVAEWLLSWLHTQGVDVAYLSRGYGRRSKGYLLVNPKTGNADQFGDEALQVACKFPRVPVAVCEDRVQGVQRLAEEEGVKLVVLDDAFQHRRIRRQLDLVVIDASRLPTSDWLLPVGRLRERRRHLRRADMLIVNKLLNPAKIPAIEQTLTPFECPVAFAQPTLQALKHWQTGETHPLIALKRKEVILLAGIGNPQVFQRQMGMLGARVIATHFYRDHRPYQPKDFVRLREAIAQHTSAWILTTEKDVSRLVGQSWTEAFVDLPIYQVPIEISWLKGADMLIGRIQEVMKTGKRK